MEVRVLGSGLLVPVAAPKESKPYSESKIGFCASVEPKANGYAEAKIGFHAPASAS